MKKTLLFLLAASASVVSATAEIKTPELINDASIHIVSANGRYAVSELYGTLKIFDLVEGTSVAYEPDEDWVEYYTLGNGNGMTHDGSILVASTKSSMDAAYLENGEWHQLDVPDPNMTNISNGITPDGSRICGSIGLNPMTLESKIMQVPVYWDRKADGSGYGECQPLPYPTTDLFGEVPQYVTALYISDDGKTIAGQMVFNSGMMTIPVIYYQDAEGEWSYDLPTKDLFNPEGIEAVENPGDGPEPPFYEDFMTPEELEAYHDALNGYEYGSGDPYPEFTDFITPEEKAEYDAAMEAYQALQGEWYSKYVAFADYRDEVIATSPNFQQNNCFLSTDGKFMVSTLVTDDPNADPMGWGPAPQLNTPATVNLETGALVKIDTELSLTVSGVANNGVILAHNGMSSNPTLGYVIKDGDVQTLTDYLGAISPEFVEWIDENMTHEVVVDIDWDTWEEIWEELTYTGIPAATPDLRVITIWNTSPWDDWEGAQSVVFHTSGLTGISTVGAGVKNIKAVANGVIAVPEGFSALDVFDVNGRCIKSVGAPNGEISLKAAPGVYVAKGTRADGTISVVKIVCN
ncbi:MAG: hypothetical protein K2M12_00215 [Muribaculaceae bacterium]|nr:hypothetical protein [Muribaculaceae bacterium]